MANADAPAPTAAPPAAPAPAPAAAAPPAEPTMSVLDYVTDGRHAVGVAGLVTDDPTLTTAKLTRAVWDERLQAYLASERP